MRKFSLIVAAVLATALAGCGGEKSAPGSGSASGSAAAPAKGNPPPADAKSVADFKKENPSAGSTAKIHGFVGSTNGKAWVLVDKPGETMPFVFCDMASPPAGVEKGAHVVASGKVEDTAMLKECTITPL